MEIKKLFAINLKQYFDSDGACKQSELADRVGVSPQFISGIVTGKTSASEETRRKIAAFIGLDYNQMIGLGPEVETGEAVGAVYIDPTKESLFLDHSDIDAAAVAAVVLSCANLTQVAAAWPEQIRNVLLVPVVRLETVLAGSAITTEDVVNWVTMPSVPPFPDLVAVELDINPFASRVRGPVTVIVDRGQREVVDGAYYLMRSPSRFLVQQAYAYRDSVVLLSCAAEGMRPQMIGRELCPDSIIGRVVRAIQTMI